MRRLPNLIAVAAILGAACTGILIADTPFGDNTISITQTANSGSDSGNANSVPAGQIDQILSQVNAGNAYAGEYGANRLIKNAIIKVHIDLKDETGGEYKRVALLESIISSHGGRITSQQKGEKQTGNIFNRKKWTEATYEFEIKDYVGDKLVSYYNGKKLADVSPAFVPTSPELADAIALEKRCVEDEKSVVDWELELDKLYISRAARGTFDLSGKSADDKRINEILNNLIPGKKSAIADARRQVDSKLANLGTAYQNKGDFNQALAYYKLHGITDDATRLNAGNCLKGLKSYDQAITMFKAINPPTEASILSIADCQHAQGNDQDAANSLVSVLKNFHNTPEELSALQKLEEWKILSDPQKYANIIPQVADVYLQKAFLNASKPSTTGTAAQDYNKACGLRAAGNAAEGSRQLIGAYQATVNKNSQDLQVARQQSEQRFLAERETYRQNYVRAQQNYDYSVQRARAQYNEEMTSTSYQLQEARRALAQLQANKPAPTSGSTTDPYANKPSTGGSTTDPYGGKSTTGGSSSDPYASTAKPKPTTSSDPYASTSNPTTSSSDPYASTAKPKPSTSSDPYASTAKPKTNSTDPYARTSNDGTDPYSNSGSTTDPYASQLSDAQAKVNALENRYRYLASNQDGYISERTVGEYQALQISVNNYRNYDLSRKDAYVENDPNVNASRNALNASQSKLTTAQQLAVANGFSS
ncbi:MAG: hypothetical protein HQM08_15270 [Candidatus Riflebacteria bacterium]|nr:hypothetical protein [Candidatus Riflebacteria bacterium]